MSSLSASQILNQERARLSEKLINAKRAKNLTWEDLAKQLKLSPVFLASVGLGQNSLPREDGLKLLSILGVESENAEENSKVLSRPPLRNQEQSATTLFQDPFMARIREINLTYGLAMMEVVQEKFGDGIMSAIDFKVSVDKIEDPAGDRVQVTLNGKFLPFKQW